MKKLVSTLFAVAISASAMALPVGNVWDASLYTNSVWCQDSCNDPCGGGWCDMFDWRVGFYGDYVFNKHLQNKSANKKASIRETTLMTNAGFIALNICEWIDIYATLGTTHMSQQSPQTAYIIPPNDEPNNLNFITYSTDFSWSIGGKVTLWEWGCFGVGLDAQYFRTKPELITMMVDGGVPDYRVDGVTATYSEWQVALGAAYRINIVDCGTAAIPYTAVRYNNACQTASGAIDAAEVIRVFDQQEDRSWGWAFGVTLLGCNRWSVTGEGRWGNEAAAHINTQFAF